MSNAIHAAYAAANTAVGTSGLSVEIQAMLASWSRAGTTDVRGLGTELADIAEHDCARAADLLAEIKPQLTATVQQQLAREFAEAFEARTSASSPQRPDASSSTPTEERGSTAKLALDVCQIGLSIAGIFDPTPTCDAIDGLISLLRGDYIGAGISAMSMIPYLGDAAKLGKLGKFAETVGKAVDFAKPSPRFAEQIAPALRKIDAALAAAPFDSLPASAQDAIRAMRGKIAEVPCLAEAAAGASSKVARPLGSAMDTPEVMPNFRRAGFFTDEPPVTLGYSQHIARGDLNACASGACATAVSILENGHAFPTRVPQVFHEVDAQLSAVASRNGRLQPTIEDIKEVMASRGFSATLREPAPFGDALTASQRGPVIFAVSTAGQLDHALVMDSIKVMRISGVEYQYRLFNPDEFSPIASGVYAEDEITHLLKESFSGYMLTAR